ncbi:MAG TPA: hypothetical protein VEB42_12090 [Chitinophagaceae bacterium]|nr:hypothetical protein [Chitinophagaceae bacterium]
MLLAPDNKRSEAITELLSSRPGWVIRYGLTLVLLALIAGGIGTYFIQYPDIVHAETTVWPAPASGFNCEVIIDREHLNKLQPGTLTRIRLHPASGKPSDIITARIASVDKIPAKDLYLMKLAISNESLGEADKEILQKTATATPVEIITANIRLSDRLLSQARRLIR